MRKILIAVQILLIFSFVGYTFMTPPRVSSVITQSAVSEPIQCSSGFFDNFSFQDLTTFPRASAKGINFMVFGGGLLLVAAAGWIRRT
jgi:hypothetical protein